MPNQEELEGQPCAELVIGLVGPLGTRLDDLGKEVKRKLNTFAFKSSLIKVSGLLPRFRQWSEREGEGEDGRIKHLQAIANLIREENRDGSILARAAIAEVREERRRLTGDPDCPADRRAYIISQFKHPDEIELMRQVYGPAFLLIAGHAPREVRESYLANIIAHSRDEPSPTAKSRSMAIELIEADQKSSPDFGQNVQDTFPVADVFVDLHPTGGEVAVGRYLDLEFGHPFHTPTPHEYAMYQASSVGLRSSDINRQVGAAIVKLEHDLSERVKNVEVLAVGMNEVAKRGGGFYWDQESPDRRDQALKDDRASQIKIGILKEMVERLAGETWFGARIGNKPAGEVAREMLPSLKGTQFAGIGEFSRPVHAEVAAIIDAARRGVGIDGSSLFVTTFPCHNCAKHIIATGIRKVFYLEPYPKSRANDLYQEEMLLDSVKAQDHEGRVIFQVYSGIAPRKYRTLFSMTERGTRQGLDKEAWVTKSSSRRPIYVPRFLYATYCRAESVELGALAAAGFCDEA